MKTTRHLYLSNPMNATKLDWDNPSHLLEQLTLSDQNGMEEWGWVLLGSAEVNFTVEKTFEEIIRASIGQAEKKLSELDAEFAKKRMEFTEQVNKLRAIGWTK